MADRGLRGKWKPFATHRRAPADTLIRVLHHVSWARQTLAKGNEVRGIILAESANEALSNIIREVPNVSLRFYRIGIELLEDACASA